MLTKTILLGAVRLLVGAHPRWPEQPLPARQSIFFSNHTSHLDTLVLLAALANHKGPAVRPVAARDYWGKGPLRRYVAQTVLNAVLIDRKKEEGQDPLAPLREALSHGDSLILFPEGTRSDNPVPETFRSGLYVLAKEFPEVALVPVYLQNLHRIMPKGASLPVPLISRLSFGEPISCAPDEDRGAFLSRARDVVIALGKE